MKRINIASLLIALCMQQIIFSMEPPELRLVYQTQQTNTQHSFDDMIVIIDTAINEKYKDKKTFFGTSPKLTKEEAFNIVDIMHQSYRNPFARSNDLVDTLYAKNDYFKQAIDYYITLAHENLDKIDVTNLKTIEDPKKIQPTRQLNDLPLQIKNHVMQQALKQFDHTYDILLTGHEAPIRTFDICETTHQAATACKDNTFCLWDLKTGKLAHTFDEKRPIRIIAFNPNGSCIAAALSDENIVQIWCPKTGRALLTLSSYYPVKSLTYTHPTLSTLTATHKDKDSKDVITQWTLTTHNAVAGECFNCSYVHGGRKRSSFFNGTCYTTQHPRSYITTPNHTLCVTKNNCNSLCLVKKAIEKTQSLGALRTQTIERSQSYHSLTSLEMIMATEELRKKIATLNN